MHSNVRFMLDKTVGTVPFGNGAFPFYSQKDLQGVAEMYSLSEFDGITENTPFADWYYARRFGGTPNLKSISGLFDPSDSNNNETE